MPLDFERWFKAQFGEGPKREPTEILQDLQAAESRVAELREELLRSRIWNEQRRAALYTIQAERTPGEFQARERHSRRRGRGSGKGDLPSRSV